MLQKKTFLAIAAFSLFVSGIISSCDDSPTGTSASSDKLVGKWVVEKKHTKGTMSFLDIPISMDTTEIMNSDKMYVQFYSDNTYKGVGFDLEPPTTSGLEKKKNLTKITQSADVDTGTWSLSGNTLSLKSIPNDTTIVMQEVAINGNSLNMKMPIKMSTVGLSMDLVVTIYLSKK